MSDIRIKYEIGGQPVELVVPEGCAFVEASEDLFLGDPCFAIHFHSPLTRPLLFNLKWMHDWPAPIRRLFACLCEHECRKKYMRVVEAGEEPEINKWFDASDHWHAVAEEAKEVKG